MIPVIIGATGTISKSLKQYLMSNITEKQEFKELRKPAILCTVNILREVLI
jgi:hypothetical protein